MGEKKICRERGGLWWCVQREMGVCVVCERERERQRTKERQLRQEISFKDVGPTAFTISVTVLSLSLLPLLIYIYSILYIHKKENNNYNNYNRQHYVLENFPFFSTCLFLLHYIPPSVAQL